MARNQGQTKKVEVTDKILSYEVPPNENSQQGPFMDRHCLWPVNTLNGKVREDAVVKRMKTSLPVLKKQHGINQVVDELMDFAVFHNKSLRLKDVRSIFSDQFILELYQAFQERKDR